jgi:predicted RNA binding protein YcfA (HicA-like mRNA interferase family)
MMRANETSSGFQGRRRAVGCRVLEPAGLREPRANSRRSRQADSRRHSTLHHGVGGRSSADSGRAIRHASGCGVNKLPAISGRECTKALGKAGFRLRRQEGSHMVLRRDQPFAQVVVPDHKELDRGTLRRSFVEQGLRWRSLSRCWGDFPNCILLSRARQAPTTALRQRERWPTLRELSVSAPVMHSLIGGRICISPTCRSAL